MKKSLLAFSSLVLSLSISGRLYREGGFAEGDGLEDRFGEQGQRSQAQ